MKRQVSEAAKVCEGLSAARPHPARTAIVGLVCRPVLAARGAFTGRVVAEVTLQALVRGVGRGGLLLAAGARDEN